jgi:type IV pilus assembly protein PilY1
MFTKKLIKGLAVIVSTSVFSMSTIQSAFAAPGTLATAPLFLSNSVEPNVFFTLDDSGSMDYELVVEDTTANTGYPVANGLPTNSNGSRIGYLHPTWTQLYTGRAILPPSDAGRSAWDRYWVFRNHNGNKLYYNPDVEYIPWVGYPEATATSARKDPNNASPTVNLNTPISSGGYLYDLATYYIWTDTNGNGVIEHDLDARDRVTKTDPRFDMQNFANWFVYYRSRINLTKSAIGAVMNNTDASRMGLRVFNGYNGVPHRTDLKTMGIAANKIDLLKEFYTTKIPARGTPGRAALKATGEMFLTNTPAAILPQPEGGECQQHFNIFMSDGYWNSSTPSGIGDRDKNGGDDPAGGSIFDGNAGESNDLGNYADKDTGGVSNTLADVAMKYYETDLSTLDDKVPTHDRDPLIPTYQSGVDEAPHQHLVNYTIALGISGSLDVTVAPTATSVPGPAFAGWPTPVPGEITTVDDMWHAAYNSRGEYLNAQTPEQFKKSLSEAISNIAKRTATSAAVSINSAKLTTESVVYLAEFNTNRWLGNLFAYKITDTNTGALSIDLNWGVDGAAGKLNTRNLVTAPRTILTHNGSGGVPFQWNGLVDQLSDSQKDDLRINPAGGTDDVVTGMARVEYLRGSQDDEAGGYNFRTRQSLLSDLVNSGPVFVGAPTLSWPDKAPFPTDPTARYSTFKNGPAKTRDGMVYVGSNGGMLHGFAEADGEEKIAYIPGNLFSTASDKGLHYLTDPAYSHTYYNDLTPTISDIYADIGNSVVEWNTVLISGQRAGGRGIFALDVTNPANFDEGKADDLVLWEFSNSDDADLGYTYSKPQIARTNAGTWVAIFGNGYNDTGDGKAKLFIVDIARGAVDGTWVLGTNYIKISTNSGDLAPDQNGLASPALADLDGNGTVDRVYAGDLQGQMWSFDLSSTNPDTWDDTGSVQRLFTTINNEPITSQPGLAKHPNISTVSGNAPNVMVFFGSGQYLVDDDKDSDNDNYFYGVWDNGDINLTSNDLVEQTFESAYIPARVLTRNTVDYVNRNGWYFELDVNRERSVTNPVVRGDLVFFNSFVPEDEPCTIGGFGYRFAVEMLSGGSPYEVAADADGDGDIDDDDRARHSNGTNTDTIAAIRQEGFLPEPVFIENIAYTAEKPSKVADLPEPPTGRFGWQELIQ